ncbi:MAG: T9SS type A sorting domain-containing protein [Chitinophagaceae bacterium]|nr:MAG: T9SS type A sorting domain-containing protein [Chitinophagaceae bacterium]
MKNLLLALTMFNALNCMAQIIIPAKKANVSIDAHLRSNSFDGVVDPGADDWFGNGIPGSGDHIIDTTGAAYIKQLYISNPATRRMPLFRGMKHPQFSIVNNKMLVDGVFIRDHHGDDSTVFASGSNKNGMSPAAWTTPSSQSIPDKNDILDMFMHVRRDGPNTADSLWLLGGVSIEGTGGNRYFDFEMYQTDIYYERATLSFKGFGPDAGHTSWQLDATGKVTRAGDIIFTAEYDNSSLSQVEARIWVHNSMLSIVPADFAWGGDFAGASSGSAYGYANILPKTGGNFYSGIQNAVNTWAGPFNLVRGDNSLVTDYTPKQFMEFSVNLSKLGLDPLVNTGDPCKMPFRRILVKSRASTSFSAELKDFVGPFDFFRAPMAAASADIPFYCGTSGVSTVAVNNPIVTSLYTWSTSDGHIVGDSIGSSITVNKAGSYIVSQQLMDSCGTAYAKDTVLITLDPLCMVLSPTIKNFSGRLNKNDVSLSWAVQNHPSFYYYDIERSYDNNSFTKLGRVYATENISNTVLYKYTDHTGAGIPGNSFYRISYADKSGRVLVTKAIRIQFADGVASARLSPNPAKTETDLILNGYMGSKAIVTIHDLTGKCLKTLHNFIESDMAVIPVKELGNWANGTYFVKVVAGNKTFTVKMIVAH